ncbi:rhodanese-like domain-containing protein [Microcoleus sp. Pol11C1]|uniref:rhodanese-like domain-containing protein n=1 Tax=unclassified Microcoleus TaxID=2642155 RepID=UPI002FD56836
MSHSENFQKLADEAKAKIQEVSIEQLNLLEPEKPPILVDVREESEWKESHAEGAIHLSRGTIEQKIEEIIPDREAPIVCYCGGGNRSALVAESLQKLGYTHVQSLVGGFKGWKEAGLPIVENSDSSLPPS